MKNFYLVLFILTLMNSCSEKQATYEDEIKYFQYELNRQYADTSTSPLAEEDLKTFKSLDFFEIDKNFNVKATFELTPNTPIFEMQTTTDRLPLYRKYGIARFSLKGKEFELSIYQSQDLMTNAAYEDYLFLPFNDLTNGNLSYGGGRFLDLKFPSEESNTILIDFNKAYNPYCAYNHKYSCPIPPSENTISLEILAGVKTYGKLH